MGWCFGYAYGEKDRKKLVTNNVIGEKNIDKIYYIEVRGADVWVIMKDENGNPNSAFLVFTSLKNGEFGYKDICVTCCPYSFSCSKKFRNMVEEIYKDYLKEHENEECYLKQWIDYYDKNKQYEKEKKDKLNGLKNGDIIEFEKARYGGKNRFTITKLDGANTIFDGYCRLKGWRKQEFTVVEKAV